MICATVTPDGLIQAIDPQPASMTGCTLVLVGPGELSPWALTVEQGVQISASIAALWAFAFVCRSFVRQVLYSR